MLLDPAHQVTGDKTTDHAAEKTGANHVGGQSRRKARAQRRFVCQRVGGIGRQHRHHQGAQHATAKLTVHPEPGVLGIKQMLQAEDLGQQHRDGEHGTACHDERHGKGDAAQQRLLELGLEAHLLAGRRVALAGVGRRGGAPCLGRFQRISEDPLGMADGLGHRRLDTGDANKTLLLLDGHLGGEDAGHRSIERLLRQAILDTVGTLLLDQYPNAQLATRLFQILGSHIGVGDPRRAGGDTDHCGLICI